ncbi:GIY-YIG nuclease family protein [Rhodococcus sp. BP22]|uniref:GIY-YIG nuclease family protein n=1 Tax=Rhodococcus sp. BP22 TaxID=2758566 RepID=UPI0016443CA7|nr:GIY-YIG nuclease family protein [Rhodococcus sp. BP22]
MSAQDKPSIAAWAERNKYGEVTPYSERELKALAPRTCGLYLLEFDDGQFYIGISVDIRARLRQHRVNHNDIATFRVRAFDTSSIELRRVERKLVHSAETAGFVLRNREHAAVIVGESSLDAIITPAEQDSWSRNPSLINRTDGWVGVEYLESQLAAHAGSYKRLQTHPRYVEIVRSLGAYLDACVPFPARSEGTFWTVSCFPGSSKTLLLRVSMGMLETFYVWENVKTGDLEVHMFVDGSHLPRPRLLSRLQLSQKLSKTTEVGPRGHKSAGVFERTVVVRDIKFLEDTLNIPGVARSAASHALSVMRKRQSGYKSSHCPQLASAGIAALGLESSSALPADSPEGALSEEVEVELESPNNVPISPDKASKDADKLEAFLLQDPSGEVRGSISELITTALPDHDFDVAVNWGLTCMPSTNAGRGRKRLFTLNIGRMEVGFVVASVRPEDPSLFGVAVVSSSELEARTGRTIAQLREEHDQLELWQHGYSAARGDDVNIAWEYTQESLAQLRSIPWLEASAVLADALRMTRCPYAKFHSPSLMGELLGHGH